MCSARPLSTTDGIESSAQYFVFVFFTYEFAKPVIAFSALATLASCSAGSAAAAAAAMHGGNDDADGCADDGAPPLLGSVYAGESERAASIVRKETDEKLDLPTTEEKNDEVLLRDQIATAVKCEV